MTRVSEDLPILFNASIIAAAPAEEGHIEPRSRSNVARRAKPAARRPVDQPRSTGSITGTAFAQPVDEDGAYAWHQLHLSGATIQAMRIAELELLTDSVTSSSELQSLAMSLLRSAMLAGYYLALADHPDTLRKSRGPRSKTGDGQ